MDLAKAVRRRTTFPESLLLLFGIGLAIAGLAMVLLPDEYPSYRFDAIFWELTPMQCGWSFVIAGLLAALTAPIIGGSILVGAFIARAAILFTSWLDARTAVPPPPTRWIWEVLIAVTIMAALGHRVAAVADDS